MNFSIFSWRKGYDRGRFTDDMVAALVVAVMLVPQALAYALLAGLPPQTGIYAAVFGLSAYALFGSSSTLSVAPVAVVSLMTAAALGRLGLSAPAALTAAAMTLALLSGVMLLLLGVLRLGFMANFISHPVISAFINAAAFTIAFSQLRTLLGVDGSGGNLLQQVLDLAGRLPPINWLTLSLGLVALAFIVWCKRGLKGLLLRVGLGMPVATSIARSGPLIVVIISALLVYFFDLHQQGVQVLGEVPRGLPGLRLPPLEADLLLNLWGAALLISIIGFVESVSVAQNLAARRRERVNLDRELLGLGAANMASGVGGGFPVSGGFARSVVNFDAGAATPAAGLLSALILLPVALFLTPLLYWIPQVSLAVIILAAIFALVDFSPLRRAWVYSKADFAAVALTFVLTLLVGVEIGIAAGVLVSLLIHLYKTSQPHVAVVGRVPGTEHFRSVDRHAVETFDNLLSIRVDESLYFANTRYLEELIFKLVAERGNLEHVILLCAAVNTIDLSALETLEKINGTLGDLNIKLHLSEVKEPIMDDLSRTTLIDDLSGNCYLSHNQAVEDLKSAG